MSYRVLVTGAAGQAGCSMLQALDDNAVELLACDCCAEAIGGDLPAERRFSVHRSDDPEFVGDLLKLCALHDIDVVVPTRAGDQLAIANVRKLFEGLGAWVWLAPTPEHATRSQARRILQIGERRRARMAMSSWLRDITGLGPDRSPASV